MDHKSTLQSNAIMSRFNTNSWLIPGMAYDIGLETNRNNPYGKPVNNNHNHNTTESANSKPQEPKFSLDFLDIGTTLGTGTFGRVFLAKDLKKDKSYALKVMKIREIIKLNQTEHVNNERSILLRVDHPFIVQCVWTFHDARRLYMLFEYVAGGELFTYLRSAGRFPMETAIFYTAEVITTLEYLHGLDIIYRDLKPENILISTTGHIKLTDFGFSKVSKGMTWTLCGTPEYLAPEVIQSKGHNKAVDWWALGILLYEMLVGYPPFSDDNPFGIYEKILAGVVNWPKQSDIPDTTRDLVHRLLEVDRTKRIGCLKDATNEVKSHTVFHDVNWDCVINQTMTPPIVPRISSANDTSNFERYKEESWMTTDLGLVSLSELSNFESF